MSEKRESLRETFEGVAAMYDGARPEYPHELFDDLVGLAKLPPGGRLLEVGCGTGKATRPLLERGFSVVCVELGRALAERARNNLAGMALEVHVAPFEQWDGQAESFDLVYAATAWHWIDLETRYQKAHALLRPGGHLAFWKAEHGFPVGFDSFFSEIQEVYDEIGESHPGDWPPAHATDDVAEIVASGMFADVHVRRYVWEMRYTADEYIELLNTFSGHIAMDADKREYLYRQIRERISRRQDPRVLRHWSAVLHVARRD